MITSDLRILGLVLRFARQAAGLGQHELAARCGVSQSAISRYEAGTMEVPIGTLMLAGVAVGTDAAALLDRANQVGVRLRSAGVQVEPGAGTGRALPVADALLAAVIAEDSTVQQALAKATEAERLLAEQGEIARRHCDELTAERDRAVAALESHQAMAANPGLVTAQGLVRLPPTVQEALTLPVLVRFLPTGRKKASFVMVPADEKE